MSQGCGLKFCTSQTVGQNAGLVSCDTCVLEHGTLSKLLLPLREYKMGASESWAQLGSYMEYTRIMSRKLDIDKNTSLIGLGQTSLKKDTNKPPKHYARHYIKVYMYNSTCILGCKLLASFSNCTLKLLKQWLQSKHNANFQSINLVTKFTKSVTWCALTNAVASSIGLI